MSIKYLDQIAFPESYILEDISGKRYGRLVAIEPVGKNKKGLTLWRCKCDCGNEKITTVTFVKCW